MVAGIPGAGIQASPAIIYVRLIGAVLRPAHSYVLIRYSDTAMQSSFPSQQFLGNLSSTAC